MRSFKKSVTMIIAAFSFLFLIFDTRGAVAGAQEGLQLCIRTLIPSLFPFFVISGFFCNVCATTRLSILKPVLRLCGMPDGSDSLFIIGMLGGYPVGAKSIADAYRDGQIDSKDARRMLGFCSNAGPAFVFGIIGAYFEAHHIPWAILGILILSAILTGWLLPQRSNGNLVHFKPQNVNFIKLFQNSLTAIASVCGWVILFRILISILNRWILWIFPNAFQIALTGVLELSNGCIALDMIANDGARFIISTGLLSFGGLCVYLQTVSVTGNLGTGFYFPGKILQCAISLVLSILMQHFLFSAGNRTPLTIIIVPAFLIIVVLALLKMQNNKITVAIPQELMYNTGN